MAKSVADVLLESFPSGGGAGDGLGESLSLFNASAGELPGVVSGLSQAVTELAKAGQAQTSAASTAARTASSDSGSSGGGSTVGTVVSTVLKSGLGLSPLVRGILGLFGGGGEEEPAPLVKYERPASIQLEAALWDGVVQQADYDQTGAVRRYTRPAQSTESAASAGEAAKETGSTQQVVNVTVQAMDSRSFLDHSQEIAHAVREAMLNMNSINDVVSEL
jgi:hypothetical protein